ncbi:cupin domain-containing protein [Xenorhabdus bovienii]|uniref:Cupin domain-containing protein n=1 Tax=Xenorhabdus aichiensis TaxID=3025874 RepID=A0ABT5M825_9GAMM|nr:MULTISPECIES: cupin domain-containing protein [Xenorhabdus]MDC9623854.1 cupin domain-containing protein [Xenorhabdus aichiensis]MDE1488553.1 cupin domain-containing protein [Xenorhabdus bovienii]MDE1497054.1 cupin domain-containing protein [Xenorhabdus bovienii]MDE9475108.1 cupin domain-containing protein [Xenorhabdus bovienii]MDE9532269.1 cupin domain-containing protein [Xenorhabdus bovienii]
MIDFAKFSTDGATKDDAVGISIKRIIEKDGLNAYATFISAGKKVGCHSHSQGDEWYIILSGDGEIWTGDVVDNEIINIKKEKFSKGCIFCIHQNTAHQLASHNDVELIFLCPKSHLSHDRVGFEDICK